MCSYIARVCWNSTEDIVIKSFTMTFNLAHRVILECCNVFIARVCWNSTEDIVIIESLTMTFNLAHHVILECCNVFIARVCWNSNEDTVNSLRDHDLQFKHDISSFHFRN